MIRRSKSTCALMVLSLLGVGCDGVNSGEGPTLEVEPARPVQTPNQRLSEVFDGFGPTDAAPRDLPAEWQERLDAREVDYGAALRVASLRTRGELPSMLELAVIDGIDDQSRAYEVLVDEFLDDPRFLRMLFAFFRDAMKMGGDETLDSAPAFAADVVFQDRPFSEIFTARSGTCPTYADSSEGPEIEPGDCDNAVEVHAGLLTHPGVMQHFYSNLAFRRVRWVQETFACRAFPAEFGEPRDVGGEGDYIAPWDFLSIAGESNGGRVDFHDVESAVCANCHATMNHIAPLFARFDEQGRWQEDIAVPLPLDGFPVALRTDWLPEGEPAAWRMGVVVENMTELGEALAADEEVAACVVARVWNWGLGRGDAVGDMELVPASVTADVRRAYSESGNRLKAAFRATLLSPDFVRF